ncbi:hypothetical protein EBZ37_14040, partial [bacterium]|nr:hypothetical protein [bacterium]
MNDELPHWNDIWKSPNTTDILINGPDQIFFDQGEGLVELNSLSTVPWKSKEELTLWVIQLLSSVGKTWDAKHPFADAHLPGGFRLHVAFPPLAEPGILISLRKAAQDSLGRDRWKNSHQFYTLLKSAIQRGESILISGATGSGKTTLANDLLSEVPSNERIITLEDTAELSPRHPHWIRLLSRAANADGFGEVTLQSLLKQSLRMRPDRIILGECRGSE